MKQTRGQKWAVLLIGITLPGITGACLPDGYLQSNLQTLGVALADGVFNALLEGINAVSSGI